MKLTSDQAAMLGGGHGEMLARMMRLLVRLGEVYGASRMVDVGSAQVSGVSYRSLGDPGLAFLEDLAASGVRVRVPTTMNPAGMDLEDWRAMGVPADFAARQERIVAALVAMGVHPVATCTPYLVGSRPSAGDHLAWAESSAVSFANSVLGARTNREAGPTALAAALCGCTPDHGLHRDENRLPTVVVEVESLPLTRAGLGALGCLVGRKVGLGVPFLRGLSGIAEDGLKSLGAAMAAAGAVALYHVEGVTPEASACRLQGLPTFRIGNRDIEEEVASLDRGGGPDLLVFGCPHASLEEVAEVASLVEGRRLARPLWVCTSRFVKTRAIENGLVAVIEAAGGRVVADTCMVVSPIKRMGFSTTAVDSGKAACYLPGLCGQRVVYRDLRTLISEALA